MFNYNLAVFQIFAESAQSPVIISYCRLGFRAVLVGHQLGQGIFEKVLIPRVRTKYEEEIKRSGSN